ncbi:MAG TPA: hypothetical protein VM327_09060 [Candidatus Thermoplasmatota archaeon]|nr:hypothetical protein [Candidatus Thermoplasmatota archaeon]
MGKIATQTGLLNRIYPLDGPVPTNHRKCLLLLVEPETHKGDVKQLRIRATNWADHNGFAIIDAVIEPFSVSKSDDPSSWAVLPSATELALRYGAPSILIAGLANAGISLSEFEVLKVKTLRALDVILLHDEYEVKRQHAVTSRLTSEFLDYLVNENSRRHSTIVKRRLDRAAKAGRKPGRKEKPFSQEELTLIRAEYRPGVLGKGTRSIAKRINELRGLADASPAERRVKGVSEALIRKTLAGMGLL